MAAIEGMIPFLIYFETGVRDDKISNRELYEMARAKGIANDPDDSGGATLVGVTHTTFKQYLKGKPEATMNSPEENETDKDKNSQNMDPTMERFKKLPYSGWLDILKSMFWDKWQADEIRSQSVAEMLVDWVWTSGRYGITIPQRLLGVKTDGIVGPKTLTAVNGKDAEALFRQLKTERLAYIERICARRPANKKFRKGWIRRINAVGTILNSTFASES